MSLAAAFRDALDFLAIVTVEDFFWVSEMQDSLLLLCFLFFATGSSVKLLLSWAVPEILFEALLFSLLL